MRRLPFLALGALLTACAARPAVPPAVPVFFPDGSVTLGPVAQRDVARAAAVARQYPNVRIKLVGYALPNAAPVEPIRLSEQRADAVRTELVRDGVAMQRIENANGGTTMITHESPVAGRRVDIIFSP